MTGAIALPGPEAFDEPTRVFDAFEQLNRNIPANTKSEIVRLDEKIDAIDTTQIDFKPSIDANTESIEATEVRITALEENLTVTKYTETVASPGTINVITHNLDSFQSDGVGLW